MKTVFFGASGSIVKWAYKDIYENPEIEYCEFDKKSVGGAGSKKFCYFPRRGDFCLFL